MKIQRLSSKEITIARNEDDGSLNVEGYAAVYDVDSKPLGIGNGKHFVERIFKGAFDEAVANVNSQSRDCVATYQHDRSTNLARTSSGTLHLESDEWGLKFRFVMPDTTIGRDMSVMLDRGDLSQCSFVATVKEDDMKMYRDGDGNLRQDINRISELYDVSLVIDPAYDSTYASEISRSVEEFEKSEQEVQRELEQEIATKESQDKMLINLIQESQL